MDALGTVWWLIVKILSVIVSLIWFLLSGWVSTILQVLVLIAAVYGFKYGWRRAPFEIWRGLDRFGRFFWNWVRARELTSPAGRVELRDVVREVRVKDWGDINLSTLLSIAAIVGVLSLRLLW
jgi:hypothetical protein